MRYILKHRYRDPSDPISYSGLTKLRKYFKNTKIRTLKNELASLPEYTSFREQKRPKNRNPFFIYEIRRQIQMDLIEFQKIASENDGIRYLLVAIDTFSKYVVVIPMKNKSAEMSLNAIKEMLRQFGKLPREILSDHGKEFINQKVKDFLESKNIEQTFSTSDLKAAIVERANKTLQSRIYKQMFKQNNQRYIDDLPSIVSAYNNSIHSTIKMSPNEAEKPENQVEVRSNLGEFYYRRRKKPTFKNGEVVTIAKANTKFSRSYHVTQTSEPFIIREVNKKMPIPMYFLKSLVDNDEIEGGFYGNELTKITCLRGIVKKEENGKILVKWNQFKKSSWISAELRPYFDNC